MTPHPRGNESTVGSDDAAGPPGRGPTRRQALALAGGSAAAVGLALGPFSHLFAGAADGDQPPEVALTTWLIGLELAAVTLYEPLHTDDAFDQVTQSLVGTCAGHHDAQSAALGSMVTAAGGEVPTDPNQAFVDTFKGRIDGAADGAAKAAVLAEMENGFAATYEGSFTILTSPSLAATAAQILATDAAHAVAWAAAASGQGSDNPLPPPDAIPESQTDTGRFTETTFTENTTTTAAPETTTGEAS